MENKILEYLMSQVDLSEEEKLLIAESVSIQKFKKGTLLLKEGEVPKNSFFVIEGCIRQYYLLDGEEKTTHFYTEEQSTPTHPNFKTKAAAKHYLECSEDTTVAVCKTGDEEALFKGNPKLEALSRQLTEQDYANSQEKFSKFIYMSPEERYLDLLENRADLINRVPQYQLASYLGIKPESLSRIRKRIFK